MRTIQVEGGEVFPRTPLNSTTAQCVGICATRHKFETVLRQQVLAKCPGIELTSGGTVKGLLLSNDRTAVTGGHLVQALRLALLPHAPVHHMQAKASETGAASVRLRLHRRQAAVDSVVSDLTSPWHSA